MVTTVSKFKNINHVNISDSIRVIFLLNFHFGFANRDIESYLSAFGYNKNGYSSAHFLCNSSLCLILCTPIQYTGARYQDIAESFYDVYDHYVHITDATEIQNSGVCIDTNGSFGISFMDIVGGILALTGTKIILSKELMCFLDIDQICTKFIGRIFQTSDNSWELNQKSIFREIIFQLNTSYTDNRVYRYKNPEKNPFFICRAKYADVILELKCAMYTLLFCYIANANRIYGLEFDFIAEESVDKYERAQFLATELFENALTKKTTVEFYQVNYVEILRGIAAKLRAIASEAHAQDKDDVFVVDSNLPRVLLIQLALIKNCFVEDLLHIANSLERLSEVTFCILSVPDFVINAMNATKFINKTFNYCKVYQ